MKVQGKRMRSQQKLRSLSLASALWGVAGSALAQASAPMPASAPASAELAEPEEEMVGMLRDIDRLQSQVRSLGHQLAEGRGRLSLIHAKQILARADRNFAETRFYLAIANYVQYLKANPKPAPAEALAIQFNLGRAYEQTGNATLAFEACQNYIATFITAPQKNYRELMDVVKRLLRLDIFENPAYQESLRKVFTTLISLPVPPTERYELTYYTARAAARAGMHDLAKQWLANTAAFSGASELKARAQYFQGLIAAALGSWEQAEAHLQKCVYYEEQKPGELQPYAYLSLARVLSYRDKTNMALAMYEKVDSASPLGKEAHYEQIFLHFKQGNFRQARTLAASFLGQFENDRLGKGLHALVPYLNLRAGDHALAEADLAASQDSLAALKHELQSRYRPLSALQDVHARDLATRVDRLTPPSPLLRQATKAYQRRDDEYAALAQIDGQLSQFLAVLSRLELKAAFPALFGRRRQVLGLSEQALAVGHRLVATEKLLWDSVLPEPQRLRLAQLWKRRQELSSGREAYYRAQRPGRYQAHFLHASNRVVAEHARLQKLKAQLAGYHFQASKVARPLAADAQRQLTQAMLLAQQQEARLGHLLSELRRTRTRYSLEESLQPAEKTFITQYGAVLSDEMAVLAPYLEHEDGMVDHLLRRDLVELHEKWQSLMKGAYTALAAADQDIRSKVESLLARVDELQEASRTKRQQLASLSQATDGALTQGLDPILSHYESLISERQARNLAWIADAKWLAYEKSAGEQAANQARFQLDKEILDNHLYQLQNGVLWQWPQ